MRRILEIALALIIVLAMVRHAVGAALGAELEAQRRFVILTRLAARRSRLGAGRIKAIDFGRIGKGHISAQQRN